MLFARFCFLTIHYTYIGMSLERRRFKNIPCNTIITTVLRIRVVNTKVIKYNVSNIFGNKLNFSLKIRINPFVISIFGRNFADMYVIII